MREMKMSGTGWVIFLTVHPYIDRLLIEYARANPRHTFVRYVDGHLLWRRDPDSNGRGVRKGNEVQDFLRVVANAVLKFSVSTVENGRKPGWNVPEYRAFARTLVQIVDHGWDVTPQQASTKIDHVLQLEVHVHDDGRLSGKVIA